MNGAGPNDLFNGLIIKSHPLHPGYMVSDKYGFGLPRLTRMLDLVSICHELQSCWLIWLSQAQSWRPSGPFHVWTAVSDLMNATKSATSEIHHIYKILI